MTPSSRDRALGMDAEITRRDFLGSIMLGSGASLLGAGAPRDVLRTGRQQDVTVPDWGSYGGVGDYADSYGNTEAVARAAHAVRTGQFRTLPADAIDTGETYDVVIVGCGFSGLSAAFELKREAPAGTSVLLIDNHPIFGGEAKRNEFDVDGVRLMGPQGSNGTIAPELRPAGDIIREIHDVMGIPFSYEHQAWDESRFKPLEFPRDNYGFLLWGDKSEANGYFFAADDQSEDRWARNIFHGGMDGAAWPEEVRRDMLAWRTNTQRPYGGDDFEAWLDSMTLGQYIERELGFHPAVTRFLNPIVASGLGLGGDVLSAYRAYASAVPGFDGFAPNRYGFGFEDMPWISFPGGNTGIARHWIKWLIPDAIPGPTTLENVTTGRVDFAALDRSGQPFRMRLGSTVVHVRHEDRPGSSRHVVVGYTRDGKTYVVRARHVVMGSGSWINRNVIVDAPAELHAAWAQLSYAPILSINVALRNWRFLYEIDMTACRWFSGLGFAGNIRRPMVCGDYRMPLDPDRPIVFTMYVPFSNPEAGNAHDQGRRGREELLATPYVTYERRIREHMTRLFGAYGFEALRDIAGIVLNRWGHAYVVATPGFHFGSPESPTPRDVIWRGHDRIRFGHSELRGHQSWTGAVIEGRRAGAEVLERM